MIKIMMVVDQKELFPRPAVLIEKDCILEPKLQLCECFRRGGDGRGVGVGGWGSP